MEIRFDIKKEVQLKTEILEEKINSYLKRNFYRIIEKGPGFIIFIDDEFSDRKRLRFDYNTRIRKGKFEFHSIGQETYVRLIYFIPVLYLFVIIMLFAGIGMYSGSTILIVFSLAFSLPVIYKIYYLNEHVFKEILEC